MTLVDTCGWIEWLTDGDLAGRFEPFMQGTKALLVPTNVQYELYKWVKRETDETKALEVIALTDQAHTAPLTRAIALAAGDLSLAHQLAFADAVIYATARGHQVELITSDDHFRRSTRIIVRACAGSRPRPWSWRAGPALPRSRRGRGPARVGDVKQYRVLPQRCARNDYALRGQLCEALRPSPSAR